MRKLITYILLVFPIVMQGQESMKDLCQVISGTFNKTGIYADGYTYYYTGKIDTDHAYMHTQNQVENAALEFELLDKFVNADFSISLTLNQLTYTLHKSGNVLFDTTNGLNNELYSEGFEVNSKITIGFDDGTIVFKYQDQILTSYSVGSGEFSIKGQVTLNNDADLEAICTLTEKYFAPQIRVNFVDTEYIVNEGESVNVEIDLTAINTSDADFLVYLNFTGGKNPHFDDFNTIQAIIPSGSIGPVSVSIQTDLPNGLEDENLVYNLEIYDVDGTFLAIGDKNIATITVVDDFIPFPNTLNPGDLMFSGYDNEIEDEKDRLMLTNLVPIKPNTSFQIVRAIYDEISNQWYHPSNLIAGNPPSILVTYIGESILDVNSVFCLDLSSNDADGVISLFQIDGVESNDLFTYSIDGGNTIEDFDIKTNESNFYHLMQGAWVHLPDYSQFYGNVLSGIAIGGTWLDDGNATTSAENSNIHEDIACFETQGPTVPGSYWGYFSCEAPYNVTLIDLREQIANYTNWTEDLGDASINLPEGICESNCVIVETYDLSWLVEPTDLILECDGTNDPSGLIQDYLTNHGNSSIEGGCAPIVFTNDYSGIIPGDCGAYTINWTVNDGCGNEIFASSIITIEDTQPPVILGIQDVTVSCTNVGSINASVLDGCNTNVDLSFVDQIGGNTNDPAYWITRTWTAIDVCGNVTEEDQTIVINNDQDFAEAGPNQYGCFGEQFTLVATGGTMESDYSWNNGMTGSQITVEPTGSINHYSVSITDGDCVDSDGVTVFLENGPTVIFSTINGNDADENDCMCVENILSISTSDCDNCSYDWDVLPDGGTSGSDNLSYVNAWWATPGYKTVELTLTDNTTGCSSIISENYTVYQVEAEVDQDVFNICPGDEIIVNGSHEVFPEDRLVMYLWRKPNGQVINSAINDETFVYTPTEEGEYELFVRTDDCGFFNCETIATFQVNFIDEPFVEFEIIPDCDPSPEPLDIVFLLDNSGSIDDFEFEDMEAIILQTLNNLEESNSDFRFAILQYYFLGESSQEDNNYVIISQNFTTVIPNEINRASTFGGADLNFALGLIDGYINDSELELIEGREFHMVVFTDDVIEGLSPEVNRDILVNDHEGIFSIVRYQIGQNDETANNFIIDELASEDFYYFPTDFGQELPGLYENIIECDGLEVVEITNECSSPEYTWSTSNGGSIIQDNGASIIHNQDGDYSVTISCSSLCEDIIVEYSFEDINDPTALPNYPIYRSDNAEVIILDNEEENNTLRIYPNPASDQFTLEYLSSTSELTQLTIINLDGKKIAEHSFQMKEGINTSLIPLEGITSGVYFVQMKTVGRDFVERLIIIND